MIRSSQEKFHNSSLDVNFHKPIFALCSLQIWLSSSLVAHSLTHWQAHQILKLFYFAIRSSQEKFNNSSLDVNFYKPIIALCSLHIWLSSSPVANSLTHSLTGSPKLTNFLLRLIYAFGLVSSEATL